MKISNLKYLFSILLLFTLTSCEDVIDVNIDNGKSQLVVDAFMNDLPQNQVIRLTVSAPYFNNTKAAPALGGTVKLIENGNKEYTLIDLESNGNYTYIYNPLDSFCAVGKSYKLEISYNGQEYNGLSKVNQVPAIDSIISKKDKNSFTGDTEYKAEFFSFDFKGTRDFYWVKAWYNDTLKSIDNSDIIFDGSFGGTGVDGLMFIVPMRETINRQGDPYFVGDTIRMQLLSINEDTYNFLNDLVTQLNNGGLFATPLTNVRTNIININATGEKALGWFVSSSVKTAGIRIKEEK